ncbi:MAG: hypothetical protein IKF19_06115 [Bacilli bacterium]|nr:hypothetical protein [Bacilli bacterium]
MVKKTNKEQKKVIAKNRTKLTKQKIFYSLIASIDITFIIYCAKHNYANYVNSPIDGTFFVGDSKDLLFGKNYINLIFTTFIYIYLLLSNKIFFNKKTTKKNMLKLLITLFLINTILFFAFTKRIY